MLYQLLRSAGVRGMIIGGNDLPKINRLENEWIVNKLKRKYEIIP